MTTLTPPTPPVFPEGHRLALERALGAPIEEVREVLSLAEEAARGYALARHYRDLPEPALSFTEELDFADKVAKAAEMLENLLVDASPRLWSLVRQSWTLRHPGPSGSVPAHLCPDHAIDVVQDLRIEFGLGVQKAFQRPGRGRPRDTVDVAVRLADAWHRVFKEEPSPSRRHGFALLVAATWGLLGFHTYGDPLPDEPTEGDLLAVADRLHGTVRKGVELWRQDRPETPGDPGGTGGETD